MPVKSAPNAPFTATVRPVQQFSASIGIPGPPGPPGVQTPWTSDIQAQHFNLFGCTLITSIGLNLAAVGAQTPYINLGVEGGINRWNIGVGGAESGGNSGSDLQVNRYDDGGNYLGTPLQVNRATGQVGVGAGGLFVFGDVNITGQYQVGGVPVPMLTEGTLLISPDDKEENLVLLYRTRSGAMKRAVVPLMD